MFSKILIANRGEIACRVILSAKKMRIKTVAVFSEIDSQSRHVGLADEAYKLGSPSPQESYLNASRIIEIALAAEAEAIHPGYGFLSEDSKFASACHKVGLIFIGPTPEVIANMGNKDQAKSIMEKASIPTTPGYLGDTQTVEAFAKAAEKIGYPVLLKAAAGGGGKGMRFVESANALKDAIVSAKRESKASFGDDKLFLEKYIKVARHVELQVFADTHGNKVHLYNRDCSIQRRHQKIIEEAPAPHLPDKTCQAMQATAIKVLDITNYVNAGTIEFLVDEKQNFYFMEMNTRLQVEHPVTEMITGLDLVEWQIRVAAGEPLPLKQKDIKMQGHAIEARICAEDPYENYSPSIGNLSYINFPEPNECLRVDTGVRQGDEISLHYDSMIAKVIAYADNREDAILRLREALVETQIIGVKTNTELLRRVCEQQDFIAAKISTAFINKHPALLKPITSAPAELLILVSLYQLHRIEISGHQLAHASEDRNSPWFLRDQWRLNTAALRSFYLWHKAKSFYIQITRREISINGKPYKIKLIWQDDFQLSVEINGKSFNATVVAIKNSLHAFFQGQHYYFDITDPHAINIDPFEAETHLGSPMPGSIIEVLIKPNQSVKKGDILITLEAMKMEHKILAPADGKIKAICCQPGDSVVEGVNLIEFEKNS